MSISHQNVNGSQLRFGASGTDIIRVSSGISPSFGEEDLRFRRYIGPAQSGKQVVVLPSLSPSLADNFEGAQRFYERSFEGGYPELMHYPGINSDYPTFLRKVMGSAFTQDWRVQEEYEKLRAKL